MQETKCILKRIWQSQTGLRETLYLGYDEYNKLRCIPEKEKAKVMTKEECEEWLLVLSQPKAWSIEEIKEDPVENKIEEVKEVSEEGKVEDNGTVHDE